MSIRLAGAAAAALAFAGLAACTTTATQEALLHEREAAAMSDAERARFEADREAILAMTGDYRVTFHFEETVALGPDYELRPVNNSGGRETVFVVEDTGDVIRLQHILAVGPLEDPIVVKHWRQDWVYEPETILEYTGHNRWTTRAVSAEEREGAWSQTVYQVDDSPRYAAVAPWRHVSGASTWESPWSWRPLPRRDATTRDDYNVMNAVNRHTITPWGWVHEQDNEKLVLEDGETFALVREVGLNTYRAVDTFPDQPVEDYWARTEDFWEVVRARWAALEGSAHTIDVIGAEPDDPLYWPILEIVEDLEAGEIDLAGAVEQFDAVMAERVIPDAPSEAPLDEAPESASLEVAAYGANEGED